MVQKATVDNHRKAGKGSAINGSVAPAPLQLHMGENPSQETAGYGTVGGKYQPNEHYHREGSKRT